MPAPVKTSGVLGDLLKQAPGVLSGVANKGLSAGAGAAKGLGRLGVQGAVGGLNAAKTVGTVGLEGAQAAGQLAARAGGAAGRGLANYGSAMAGLGEQPSAWRLGRLLQPGQTFMERPLRAAFRAGTTPMYEPFTRDAYPATTTGLRWGSRAVLGSSLVAGAASVPGALRSTIANSAQAFGGLEPAAKDVDLNMHSGSRQATFDSGMPVTTGVFTAEGLLHKQLKDNAGTIAGHLLPSSLGGDPTWVGDAARQVLVDQTVPAARYQLNNLTTNGPGWGGAASPYIGKALDAARSATPLGALFTAGMYGARSPEPPDYRSIVGRAVKKVAPQAIADPGAAVRSPLVSDYASAFGSALDPSRSVPAYQDALQWRKRNWGSGGPRPIADRTEDAQNSWKDLTAKHFGWSW